MRWAPEGGGAVVVPQKASALAGTSETTATVADPSSTVRKIRAVCHRRVSRKNLAKAMQ